MKQDSEVLQSHKMKYILEELSKMPPMVIETAYLYTMNFELYGVDVTKEWVTATQNASALSKAYEKGYYDGLKRQAESEDMDEFTR